MVLPRFMTALLGMPLILLCIHWGGIPFFVLNSALIIIGLYEFYQMALDGGYDAQPIMGQILGFVMLVAIIWNGSALHFKADENILSFLVVIIIICMFCKELFVSARRQSMLRISITFIGIFLVVWTLAHMSVIREMRPWGRENMYFLVLVIWVVDSTAFLFGKKFGKLKLAKHISPYKTVEGTLAGILAGLVAGILLRPFTVHYMSILQCMMSAVGLSILAQVSDLAESIIKRSFGVKDASALLPGHGGILDRFDSFIFTTPVFYYWLLLLK